VAGLEARTKQGIFFYCSVQTVCGTQIAFYSEGTGRIFPGDKAAETETDRLHLSSAEVKNEWRYTSFPSHVFLVGTRQICLCLICMCSCRIRSHFTPSIRFGPISMAPRSVSIPRPDGFLAHTSLLLACVTNYFGAKWSKC